MQHDRSNPERKTILQLYAAFGVGLALSVMPSFMAAGIAGLLMIGVLVAAYVLREGAEPGTLTENHMTWIIRTIWLGSMLAVITMAIACIYLYKTLDNTPLDPCIQKFYSLSTGPSALDMTNMGYIFQGCMVNYFATNLIKFIIAAAMSIGPTLLYFVSRFARGLIRAFNGYRMASQHHWL